MSRRPRMLSPEERELWRKIARGVRPLDPSRLRRLEDPDPPSPGTTDARPPAAPVKGASRPAPVPAPKSGPAPPEQSGDRRMRRGRVEVEARLDLHGLTSARAREALLGFLGRAQAGGLRCVLVITGKGAGAHALDRLRYEPFDPEARPLPGVLRRAFSRWMGEPEFARLVSGYAPAHRRHGGDGAFYVMVRRAPPR